MPPAAIGAVFVAMGASAATGATVPALATGAYIGAAVGAGKSSSEEVSSCTE